MSETTFSGHRGHRRRRLSATRETHSEDLLLLLVLVLACSFGCAGLASSNADTKDNPPAKITVSNVSASSLTASAATITWTTNVGGSSQVLYGTSSTYGQSTALNNTMLTNHSVSLSGLTPSTLYHYQVVSVDASNNVAKSADATFTTLADPSPVISGVSSNPGSSSIAVSWTTDKPATSQVDYGTSNNYGQSTALDSTLVTSHSVTISGLAASTTYDFRVDSADSLGTLAQSGNFTAQTTGGNAVAPSITSPPVSQAVTIGQTATFSVTASGTQPLSYQWLKNGGTIANATSSTYTTPVTAFLDGGTQFTVTVSNAAGNATSQAAQLTVNPASAIDVLTYHNDNSRTGQNLNEVVLTPANVKSTTFGKIGNFAVDGLVDAQPLYLSNVSIPGKGTHDVLYVVTENDTAYAFDAITGAQLWVKSALGQGESASDNRGCGQVSPKIGITSTPVIDRSRGPNGAIYLIAMSKDASSHYFQRLHALDITTGAELFAGPTTISATFPKPGGGGSVTFDPGQYKERVGLVELNNGNVYTAWASHCDIGPYTGWVMAFSASNLSMTSVLNITPNGGDGAFWQAGAGIAADSSGTLYLLDGNGTFDTTLDVNGFPNKGDYGNAFLKISTASGLSVADYFTMDNEASENAGDVDLSSGGALLLPDLTDNANHIWHLAIGAGKDSNIYVVNRDAMGKFMTNTDAIYQELDTAIPNGIWAMPAYFNNTVYYGGVSDPIMAFPIVNAKLAPPTSLTGSAFGYPGVTPGISSNGTGNAILWAVENSGTAVLHAYDATNLNSELYNSNQAANGRDHFASNKFITPTIANGRVYVGTPTGVAVFSLLP